MKRGGGGGGMDRWLLLGLLPLERLERKMGATHAKIVCSL